MHFKVIHSSKAYLFLRVNKFTFNLQAKHEIQRPVDAGLHSKLSRRRICSEVL
jgi:hypothetical protein